MTRNTATKKPSSSDLLVAVSDLRQYLYCPRIIYWRRVLRFGGKETPLMLRGKELQSRSVSRALELVPLRGCRAMRDIYMTSDDLGLRGRLDALIVCNTKERAYPLEVKHGNPASSHKVQLAAYSLLVERVYNLQVNEGFLYYPKKEGLVRVIISPELRKKALDTVNRIREILIEESLPPPTKNAGKCFVCEHYVACRRV